MNNESKIWGSTWALLDEEKVPVGNRRVATSPTLEVEERRYDNTHCPRGKFTTHWLTDGHEVVVSEEQLEQPKGYFRGGGKRFLRIEGATFMVAVHAGKYRNGVSYEGQLGQVVIWPNCDHAGLAKKIAELKTWRNE